MALSTSPDALIGIRYHLRGSLTQQAAITRHGTIAAPVLAMNRREFLELILVWLVAASVPLALVEAASLDDYTEGMWTPVFDEAGQIVDARTQRPYKE